ncbi:MAG TPA: 4Fe-4S dicluster domain-containing protein [Candidatus Bathyarchaeia archaeon]|nr:4Fe-4S dicluster domain-containing protein [Candidatus Bathyarchaeia archaeon]
MRYMKIKNENIFKFLECLKSYGTLYAPKKISDKSYDFRKVEDVHEVVFNYDRTILPPRQFFYPPKESLFEFNKELVEMYEIFDNKGPVVLFGVHSCDIVGLRIMDSNFIDDEPDPYYQRRREQGIIIGISCLPDEYCFCNVRRTEFVDKGFDLYFSEVPDGYVIRVGSIKGHKLIDPHLNLFEEVSDKDIEELSLFDKKKKKMFTVEGNWDSLRYYLELKGKIPLWIRESEKCLGCGNCTITCPTCRCYDIRDYPNLDSITGIRVRTWDSCQFRSHGLVAGDHNFRETKESRFKNRYMCKNAYCKQVTTSYCVGCGRCTRFCPANINFKKNLMEINGDL